MFDFSKNGYVILSYGSLSTIDRIKSNGIFETNFYSRKIFYNFSLKKLSVTEKGISQMLRQEWWRLSTQYE